MRQKMSDRETALTGLRCAMSGNNGQPTYTITNKTMQAAIAALTAHEGGNVEDIRAAFELMLSHFYEAWNESNEPNGVSAYKEAEAAKEEFIAALTRAALTQEGVEGDIREALQHAWDMGHTADVAATCPSFEDDARKLAALNPQGWRDIETAPHDEWVLVSGEMSKKGMLARIVRDGDPAKPLMWEWLNPLTSDWTYVALDTFTGWQPLPPQEGQPS